MIDYDAYAMSVEEAIYCGANRVGELSGATVDAAQLGRRCYRRLVCELGSTGRWRVDEDAIWMVGPQGMIRVAPSLPASATHGLLMVRGDAVCRIELGE